MAWRLRAIFWTAILLLVSPGFYLTIAGSGIASLDKLFAASVGNYSVG